MEGQPLTNENTHTIQLLKNVISRATDANRIFFSNLPKIIKYSKEDEKARINLISFIVGWCDLGDFVSTKKLVDNFPNLLESNFSNNKHVHLAFLPLLREVMTKCGHAITPELIIFSKEYKNLCGSKFIQTKTVPFLGQFIESDLYDVASCALAFFVNLIPDIGEENISKIISYCERNILSSQAILRLSIVNSFPILINYSDNKNEFFKQTIIKSLYDKCTIIRTRSIQIASKYVQMIDTIDKLSPFLKLFNEPSWKVKICFIENIKPFLIAFKEVEELLLKFPRNIENTFMLRESALAQINAYFDKISNTKEILQCAETAFRQKEEPFILTAMPLIPKLYDRDPSLVCHFSSLVSRFKTTKKEMVQLSILKNVVPYVSLSENEKAIILTWIKNGLNSADWRNKDITLEAINNLILNEKVSDSILSDSILSDDIFLKITQNLRDFSFNIRNRAAIVIVTYSKFYGWDFVREKVLPITRKLFRKSVTLEIIQTSIRIYVGLKFLSPPPDISTEINKVIAKKSKKNVYIPLSLINTV